MKALVYLGKSQLDYRDAADPELASGDVLVKVHACGICGSDMHGFHGDDPRRVPPMIMGHEATGVVQTGEWRGRAVAINPFLSCGECNACLSGSPQLCDKQKNLGLPPHAGGFADYVAVPRRNLVEIPEGMDFTTAALTEPLAVAYHAVGIGQRLIGKPFTSARIAVLGGGAIGLLTALVLISQGALEVLLSEPNEGRRRTAAAARGRGRTAADASRINLCRSILLLDARVSPKHRAACQRRAGRFELGGAKAHVRRLRGISGYRCRLHQCGKDHPHELNRRTNVYQDNQRCVRSVDRIGHLRTRWRSRHRCHSRSNRAWLPAYRHSNPIRQRTGSR